MSLATFHLLAFALFVLLEITGEALGVRALVVYTKPFLMIWLAAWFVTETKQWWHPAKVWVTAGLALSAVGDAILYLNEFEQRQRELFVLGALAFYAAHGAYLLALSKLKHGVEVPSYRNWLAAFWVLGAVYIFGDFVRGVRLTEFIYGAIILSLLASILLKRRLLGEQFGGMVLGMSLFIFSDLLVAISNADWFAVTDNADPLYRVLRVAIMGTYVAGQFLLVRGFPGVLQREGVLRQVPPRAAE